MSGKDWDNANRENVSRCRRNQAYGNSKCHHKSNGKSVSGNTIRCKCGAIVGFLVDPRTLRKKT